MLAASELMYHLILDPKVLLSKEENVDPTIRALVEVYGLDETELRTILKEKEKSSYVVLKRQLSYSEKDQFYQYIRQLEEAEAGQKDKESEKIKGIWFEEEYKRTYPFGNVGSHIIGFTVGGDIGTYGIEQQYNDRLVGTNGRTYGYYDSQLNIQRTTKAAQTAKQSFRRLMSMCRELCRSTSKSFLRRLGRKMSVL